MNTKPNINDRIWCGYVSRIDAVADIEFKLPSDGKSPAYFHTKFYSRDEDEYLGEINYTPAVTGSYEKNNINVDDILNNIVEGYLIYEQQTKVMCMDYGDRLQ